MKPTKRQIRIVEHFVKKTTQKVMNEANYDPNSKEYKLKTLKDVFKSMLDYTNNKEGNLNPDFIIKTCNGIIASMQKYKSANKGINEETAYERGSDQNLKKKMIGMADFLMAWSRSIDKKNLRIDDFKLLKNETKQFLNDLDLHSKNWDD